MLLICACIALDMYMHTARLVLAEKSKTKVNGATQKP